MCSVTRLVCLRVKNVRMYEKSLHKRDLFSLCHLSAITFSDSAASSVHLRSQTANSGIATAVADFV